jgi:iron(III) transport system substrate-binding protein
MNHLSKTSHLARGLIAATAVVFSFTGLAFAEVNIYSYRQPDLMAPLLAAFTASTGIETNIIFAQKGLEDRIHAEGRNSPADVLLTTDIGKLGQAKKLGIAAEITSPAILKVVPAAFRDADNQWVGLSMRARVVYASQQRVAVDDLSYADLADPKWAGRICTRSGQHSYNIGLIASQIVRHGVETTENWLAGVRDNLSRRPTGNDRAQVKAIFSGECDLALGNTYYMGLMQTNEKDPDQRLWAESVKLIFPDKSTVGTHVNLSGMVLAKNAPHLEDATKFMEFLVGKEAQRLYAELNFEYPVRTDVAVSDRVQSWGHLNPDSLSLSEIAATRRAASLLVDRINFDGGPQ